MTVEPTVAPPARLAGVPKSVAKVRIEALDVLRLLAALCVVLFHYAFRGAAADDMTRVSLPALWPIAKYGYLGVDLFFVISGFVIAWSAEGRSWFKFSVARFARVYPAFVVCMTATFLVTLLWGRPRFETSISQWEANLLVFSPAVGVPFMDGAYWSIAYELVFYGWMALLIGLRLFPKHISVILVAWLGVSMVNELALGSGAVQKLLLTNHSGFFAVGILLYLMRKGERGAQAWTLLALSTFVAVEQTLIGAHWIRQYYNVAMSNVALVSCALGGIGLVAAATAIRTLPFRAGVTAAIGGLTYPLYLLHQQAGYILFNRLEDVLSAPVLVSLTLLIMLAASWIVWRFVEPPGRRLIYRLADRSPSEVLKRRAGTSTATP
jgi:peptidoglycan/LPS O-acetylase OafA/YrhL